MAKVTSLPKAPANVLRFFTEAREELRKVAWPSRETTIRYTIIVVVSSIAIGIVTGGIDYLLTLGLEYLIKR